MNKNLFCLLKKDWGGGGGGGPKNPEFWSFMGDGTTSTAAITPHPMSNRIKKLLTWYN